MQYSQTFVDRVGGANVKQRAAAVIPIELRASNWPLASQSSILASVQKKE